MIRYLPDVIVAFVCTLAVVGWMLLPGGGL